jgi:hypothetical protein
MSEVAINRSLGRKVEKITAWTKELFPEGFGKDCERKQGLTALTFYVCASEVLAHPSVIFPNMVNGLEIDQIDDAAYYYGLQKALAYQRNIFPLE